MNRQVIINKVRQVIIKVAPDAKIILYGSVARGEATNASDIDILILLDRENITYQERTEITDHLYDIELETGEIISTFVYSKIAWDREHSATPLYQEITREGIVL